MARSFKPMTAGELEKYLGEAKVPGSDGKLELWKTTEYGSAISIMGNTSNGHMMALEKWYAGWFKGYGNLVIVDHGDGYHTLVAHLGSMSTATSGGSAVLRMRDPVRPREM